MIGYYGRRRRCLTSLRPKLPLDSPRASLHSGAPEHGPSREANALTRLIRNVAIVAAAVSIVATVAAYRQISDDTDLDEPLANDYAIADSAIQTDFLQ